MKETGFTIVTITLVVRHQCGQLITIHGDDWDDVHGVCPVCDEEYDLDFAPTDVAINEI